MSNTISCANWERVRSRASVSSTLSSTSPHSFFPSLDTLTRGTSRQDYHYLKYYARANGFGPTHSLTLHTADKQRTSLLVAKSSTYADFAAAAEIVLSIVREREMHVAFSEQWGVDLTELENTPESPACTAYGAYIMDIGMQGASSPTSSFL